MKTTEETITSTIALCAKDDSVKVIYVKTNVPGFRKGYWYTVNRLGYTKHLSKELATNFASKLRGAL